MPKVVFLWTDLVLWLLVAAVAVYVVHVRRNANLRATWRHVMRDAPAMSAAVVLIVFSAIALLDSIHFRPRLDEAPGSAADVQAAYGTRTLSLLDVLLRHAIEAREKTYSVPARERHRRWQGSARPAPACLWRIPSCRSRNAVGA